MKKLILVLVIILIPAIAFANFSIKFDNTTSKKMFYLLYWIDHTYDWPHPFNLAGGELKASETIDLSVSLNNGQYYVVWHDDGEWKNRVVMDVKNDIKSVTVTPIKSSMQK
ncbi:MAG: hypothetical protein KJP06_10695 [Deltaproteobacteria bacterium]|nr:hypothetical protein [Deltaproteobacteria bacterium]